MQFQPIVNSLHEYTQKFEPYMNKDNQACIKAYFFDFKSEPTAFSKDLIDRQALFALQEIKEIMGPNGSHSNQQFSLITHSLGSYVAYTAMNDKEFPAESLLNVIHLGSPNL